MAPFKPIEDAGPRLAFGADDFVRVFVTAASPGVVAENPQEQSPSLDSSSRSSEIRDRDGTMVLRNLFGSKRVPGNFLIGRI